MADPLKKKDVRDRFLSLVPVDARRILDVGCADGGLSATLRQKGTEIVGLEKNEDSCEKARARLSRVFLADIEKFDLPYPNKYFDCILYADILEHLVEPLALLKKHRDYLSADGCVVASIPNIRYYKAIFRLAIGGVWDYPDGGILDESHLRFFTLTNIKELFAGAGYEIVDIGRNIVAARGFRVLNFLLFGRLNDFLTYQYYIKARKSKDNSPAIRDRIRYKF